MKCVSDFGEVCSESESSTDDESLFSDDAAGDSAFEVDSLFEEDRRSQSEDDDLLARIAFHKSKGRSRLRRKLWSQSLVERELDFWRSYVFGNSLKLADSPPINSASNASTIVRCSFYEKVEREPVECLKAYEAEIIKAYLEWRVKDFRVKKESMMKSYWKRLSYVYIDTAGHRIGHSR